MKKIPGDVHAANGYEPEKEIHAPTDKQAWQMPKVRFVEPQLIERGSMKNVAAEFFGTFSPN